MQYQPLSVQELRTASDIATVYKGCRQRLVGLPKAAVVTLLPTPPRPPRDVLASIITLQAVEEQKISAHEIIVAVASAYGITVGEMKGPRRWITFINARHHAMWFMRQLRPDLSMPLIGRLLNRDHSTVHNAKRRWPEVAGKYAPEHARICRTLGIYLDNAQ